jgi:hypothetical protein
VYPIAFNPFVTFKFLQLRAVIHRLPAVQYHTGNTIFEEIATLACRPGFVYLLDIPTAVAVAA